MAEKKNTKGVVEGKGTNEIREFTPKKIKGIKDNSFMIFAAPRRAGKTVLASYILKHLGKRFSAAFVISKTSTLQGAFEMIDEKFHFNPSDTSFEEIVKTIIKFQEKRKNDKKKKVGQILVVMDDLFVTSRRGVGQFSPGLSRIAATGRHYHVFCILIAQRYQNIGSSIRSQASHYITFRPRSSKERDMLFDAYLSRESSGSKREARIRARQVMQEIFEGKGKEYRAMLIECEATSSQLKDSVYWIKAPQDDKPWKLPLKIIYDDSNKQQSDIFDTTNLTKLETLP